MQERGNPKEESERSIHLPTLSVDHGSPQVHFAPIGPRPAFRHSTDAPRRRRQLSAQMALQSCSPPHSHTQHQSRCAWQNLEHQQVQHQGPSVGKTAVLTPSLEKGPNRGGGRGTEALFSKSSYFTTREGRKTRADLDEKTLTTRKVSRVGSAVYNSAVYFSC